MRKPNLGALLGLIMFILIVVGATAAYIAYKNPNANDIVLWSIFGAVILFLIGALFFGGVKLPSPQATK